MRNVFTIASLSQTTTSEPPRSLRRRWAPISTPRLDESMNVVPVRSTTTLLRPASIGADTRCLNSGAVNRSISPVTATMWVSLSTCRSLIAKSIAMSGYLMPGPSRSESSPVRVREPDEQELSIALGCDGKLVRELLDHVADAGHRGVHDQRLASALAQRADPQEKRTVARVERDIDVVVDAVGGSAGGDQVGHQHGVVEPVEREIGARGEHADHAAQDGTHQGPGGDRDCRRRLEAPHASPSRGRQRNDMAMRLPRTGCTSRSIESASAAISGSPTPGPPESALGPRPCPRSLTTSSSRSPSGRISTSIGPSSSPR